jgi:hypothetical protein
MTEITLWFAGNKGDKKTTWLKIAAIPNPSSAVQGDFEAVWEGKAFVFNNRFPQAQNSDE